MMNAGKYIKALKSAVVLVVALVALWGSMHYQLRRKLQWQREADYWAATLTLASGGGKAIPELTDLRDEILAAGTHLHPGDSKALDQTVLIPVQGAEGDVGVTVHFKTMVDSVRPFRALNVIGTVTPISESEAPLKGEGPPKQGAPGWDEGHSSFTFLASYNFALLAREPYDKDHVLKDLLASFAMQRDAAILRLRRLAAYADASAKDPAEVPTEIEIAIEKSSVSVPVIGTLVDVRIAEALILLFSILESWQIWLACMQLNLAKTLESDETFLFTERLDRTAGRVQRTVLGVMKGSYFLLVLACLCSPGLILFGEYVDGVGATAWHFGAVWLVAGVFALVPATFGTANLIRLLRTGSKPMRNQPSKAAASVVLIRK